MYYMHTIFVISVSISMYIYTCICSYMCSIDKTNFYTIQTTVGNSLGVLLMALEVDIYLFIYLIYLFFISSQCFLKITFSSYLDQIS